MPTKKQWAGAQAGKATATMSSKLGIAIAWLPVLATVLVVYMAMEHQDEAVKRPPKPIPILATFNYFLKLAGPLFPFSILATRFGLILASATVLAPGAPVLRYTDQKIAVIFVAVTLTRMAVYALTLLSPQDTMSDHILLGVSMVVLSRMEFHASLDILMGDSSDAVIPTGDPSSPKTLGKWRLVFVVPMVMSLALMACCHGNNYVTARYFHSKEESTASVLAGLIIFEVPMSMWIMQSSGYSIFGSRRKVQK